MDTKKPPEQTPVLKFFKYEYLSNKSSEVNNGFCDLAHFLETNFPKSEEKTIALRKLLEAKDAAIRAAL